MYTVDLNTDLGESYGNYVIGNDEEIIPLISSANVACGYHAGDPQVMLNTLKSIEKSKTTGLGAHPGFPDRQGFGRRYIDMNAEEIRAMILYQISALDGMAKLYGLEVNHVKPHGALYNGTFKDYDLARTIAKTIKEYKPDVKLLGLSNQNLVKAGEEVGLEVRHEVFADRQYEDDGTLVSRRNPNALVTDSGEAVKRVIQMITEGTVESVNGNIIPMRADSICVHGDGLKALEFVTAIRKGLAEANIEIKTM